MVDPLPNALRPPLPPRNLKNKKTPLRSRFVFRPVARAVGRFCYWPPGMPHRRIEPQRMDFAVPWFTDASIRGPISFALPDPIQGQSATSLRTDSLLFPES